MRKQFLSLILSICMVFSTIPTAAMAAELEASTEVVVEENIQNAEEFVEESMILEVASAPNTTTIDGKVFYQISNYEDLKWFAGLVNGTLKDTAQTVSANAILLADIDGKNEEWSPIGICTGHNEGYHFKGIFDGANHKITNLKCSATDDNSFYVGLFGGIAGNAVIKNVSVEDSEFVGKKGVGAIAGGTTVVTDFTVIENCSSINNKFTFDSSYSDGNLGGIIGGSWSSKNTIKNCYVLDAVFDCKKKSNNNFAGGVFGYGNPSLSYCLVYNPSFVDGSATTHGGLYGRLSGGSEKSNFYYYPDSKVSSTVEDLASGKICYLLNGEKASSDAGSNGWYQNLTGASADAHPVKDSTHSGVTMVDDQYVSEHVHELVYDASKDVAATCISPKLLYAHCSSCDNDVYVKEGDALGHLIETTELSPATCSANSIVKEQCTRENCDYVVNNKEVNNTALGHDINRETGICSRCELTCNVKVGNVYYESLQEAINQASNYSQITLCSNLTLDTPLNINKPIILNLNDYTLTIDADSAEYGIVVCPYDCTVTINGNNIGKIITKGCSKGVYVTNDSEFSLVDTTVESDATTIEVYEAYLYAEDSKIISTISENGFCVKHDSDYSVAFSNCELTGNDYIFDTDKSVYLYAGTSLHSKNNKGLVKNLSGEENTLVEAPYFLVDSNGNLISDISNVSEAFVREILPKLLIELENQYSAGDVITATMDGDDESGAYYDLAKTEYNIKLNDYTISANTVAGKVEFTLSQNGIRPGSNTLSIKCKVYPKNSESGYVMNTKYYYFNVNPVVTFDADGGMFEDGSTEFKQSVSYNSIVKELPDDPVREGYIFDGWENVNLYAPITGNVTAYATWIAEGFSIRYKDKKVTISENGICRYQYTYTGSAIKPNINVYYNGKILTAGKDYSCSLKNNTNVGKASIVIKGKGKFKGSLTENFEIIPCLNDSLDCDYTSDYVYTGKTIKPVLKFSYNNKVLKEGKDYKIAGILYNASDDSKWNAVSIVKEVGDYNVHISFMNNYDGEIDLPLSVFENTAIDLKNVKISGVATQTASENNVYLPNLSLTYKGKVLYGFSPEFALEYGTPDVSTEGSNDGSEDGMDRISADYDYFVYYNNNYGAGTATVYIVGNPYSTNKVIYVGSIAKTFKITGLPISKTIFTLSNNSISYTGNEQSLNYTVTTKDGQLLKEYKDYYCEYGHIENAGKYTVTITGCGKYTGTMKKTIEVKPADLPSDTWVYQTSISYNKAGVKPEIRYIGAYVYGMGTQTLVEDEDYKISYKNNSKVATSSDPKAPAIIVKGIGNYSGTAEYSFSIEKCSISANNIQVLAQDIVYTGKAGKNTTKVEIFQDGKKLSAGTDYDKDIQYFKDGVELTKTDVLAVGDEILLKINGKGNYDGYTTCKITVTEASVAKASVKVLAKKEYTGSAVKLTGKDLIVKVNKKELVYGQDYKLVNYSNNVNTGKATVVLEGIGNYGGYKTITYKIAPHTMNWSISKYLHDFVKVWPF